MPDPTYQKTHRWPVPLMEHIEAIAKAEDRPVQHILNELLEEALAAREAKAREAKAQQQ